MRSFSLLLAAAAMIQIVGAWYVPGVTPVSYPKGLSVRILANSMTSSSSLFPYGHYSIKNCAPATSKRSRAAKTENLGELLWGDQIEPSMYYAQMQVNIPCRILCPTFRGSNLTDVDVKLIERRIENNYRMNLILDNLPISQKTRDVSDNHPPLALGYPLGVPKKHTVDGKARLHNHLDIIITYHRPDSLPANAPDEWRIVGFFCVPRSVRHTEPEKCNPSNQNWNAGDYPDLLIADANEITWSYSVTWKEDPETAWATRWDVILKSADTDAKIHWFNIVNSLLIVLFLSGMVAVIMLRSLHKDFNRYNDIDNEDAAQEETGWKLCHSDVFRPPPAASFLAILVGTGCQLLGMAIVTLIFALLGFLSPANRGALLMAMLFLFFLLGGYGGYVAAYLFKSFKVQSWTNIFGMGMFFPGVVFLMYFCMNLVQWSKNATSAIPASTLFALFGMWLGISLPLVLLGGVVGYKRPPFSPPCPVGTVPRMIPPQNWYLKSEFVIPVSGVLPFGAVFIELVFILSSLWQGRVYYVFGFLSLVFSIAIITCAEISIVATYFQLCYEDYNWWWRSFGCSGFSGVYLMLYAIFYYFKALTITQLSSAILYFGYMSIIALFFTITTGTCGFLASFFFVKTIYSYLKID